MHLKAELTFYPLSDNPIAKVKQVLAFLKQFDKLAMQTFPTATVLDGDLDYVMDCLKQTMVWSENEFGQCVFVAKFLPNYT